jgi:hypothetical protein
MLPVRLRGEATLRVADPVTEVTLAVTVVTPVPTLVARPFPSMVATPVADDAQVAEARFCVLLSVYVPVAENCCLAPRRIDGFAGVTAMDTSEAAATVRLVEPVTIPEAP